MWVIPLTSILSPKGRGGHFHLLGTPQRGMITRNKMARLFYGW